MHHMLVPHQFVQVTELSRALNLLVSLCYAFAWLPHDLEQVEDTHATAEQHCNLWLVLVLVSKLYKRPGT